jgi:hypothetical protein
METIISTDKYAYNGIDAIQVLNILLCVTYMKILCSTLDLHLFIISINSFLPIHVSLKAFAAPKFGMLP